MFSITIYSKLVQFRLTLKFGLNSCCAQIAFLCCSLTFWIELLVHVPWDFCLLWLCSSIGLIKILPDSFWLTLLLYTGYKGRNCELLFKILFGKTSTFEWNNDRLFLRPVSRLALNKYPFGEIALYLSDICLSKSESSWSNSMSWVDRFITMGSGIVSRNWVSSSPSPFKGITGVSSSLLDFLF